MMAASREQYQKDQAAKEKEKSKSDGSGKEGEGLYNPFSVEETNFHEDIFRISILYFF